MKNKTLLKLSLLLEMLITLFIPAQFMSNPAIITYKYGFPFRYLNVYSKENTDYYLFNILFKGNEGINVDIFAFVFDIIIIYFLLWCIDCIIKKINT